MHHHRAPRAMLGLALVLIAACSSSPLAPDEDSRPLLNTRDVTGSIDLPVGGPTTDPLDLEVVTAAGAAPVDAGGSFSVPAHDTERPQLVIVTHKDTDRRYALAYGRQKQGNSLRIDARSTAMSLVMVNPMFLYSADAQRDSLMSLARRHKDFKDLETEVYRAWVQDPEDPLDPDAHPQMYELAVNIAKDIIEAGEDGAVATHRRGRSEPVITDRPGTEIRYVNDMCVNFGAGVRPASGVDQEGIAIWAKEKAQEIHWQWGWPPVYLEDTDPTNTDHDMGYGRFVVEVSKGFHGDWYLFDQDTAAGKASLWNIAKTITLFMELAAGVSSAGNSPFDLAISVSSNTGQLLHESISGQDTWKSSELIFGIILGNARNIATWFYHDPSGKAYDKWIRNTAGVFKAAISVVQWAKVGWDAYNEAVPFVTDLVVATPSRTYYLIHDEGGLRVTENFPPEKPDPPIGPTTAWTGETLTYRASTTDRDDEDIAYQFWWGNDSSDWSDYLASGDTLIVEHRFSEPGNYDVAVAAIDTAGIPSELSDPLRVEIRNLPALFDMLPRSWPNELPDRPGVITAAIVGTATFDVTEIDPATVHVRQIMPSRMPPGAGPVPGEGLHPWRWQFRDLMTPEMVDVERDDRRRTTDGHDDLMLFFDNAQLLGMLAETVYEGYSLAVRGQLYSGVVFEGFSEVTRAQRGGDSGHATVGAVPDESR